MDCIDNINIAASSSTRAEPQFKCTTVPVKCLFFSKFWSSHIGAHLSLCLCDRNIPLVRNIKILTRILSLHTQYQEQTRSISNIHLQCLSSLPRIRSQRLNLQLQIPNLLTSFTQLCRQSIILLFLCRRGLEMESKFAHTNTGFDLHLR
jgi:hypothetical protein